MLSPGSQGQDPRSGRDADTLFLEGEESCSPPQPSRCPCGPVDLSGHVSHTVCTRPCSTCKCARPSGYPTAGGSRQEPRFPATTSRTSPPRLNNTRSTPLPRQRPPPRPRRPPHLSSAQWRRAARGAPRIRRRWGACLGCPYPECRGRRLASRGRCLSSGPAAEPSLSQCLKNDGCQVGECFRQYTVSKSRT